MIVNITEAALSLGYRSRSTLQRLVRDGQLAAYRVPNNGREILLETSPPGQPSLRETVQALTQYRPGSPLWQQPRQRRAVRVAELSDAELHAYCDEHLSDERLVVAMAPITEWCDAQQAPDWSAIAELANASLDCASWGPPPWTGDQWSTLRVVLELAEEAAAADG